MEDESVEIWRMSVIVRMRRRRRRRRRRWWSLLVKIEGDPLNTQHAQHRSVQATDR